MAICMLLTVRIPPMAMATLCSHQRTDAQPALSSARQGRLMEALSYTYQALIPVITYFILDWVLLIVRILAMSLAIQGSNQRTDAQPALR